jgi:hypothetical protein
LGKRSLSFIGFRKFANLDKTGWTQKEIAESEDLTQQAIDKSFTTFGN